MSMIDIINQLVGRAYNYTLSPITNDIVTSISGLDYEWLAGLLLLLMIIFTIYKYMSVPLKWIFSSRRLR